MEQSLTTPTPFAGTTVGFIPSSHLDLFWLGDYRNCLRRGDEVIESYLDRLDASADETFVIDTAIFAEHYLRTHPQDEERIQRLLGEGRLQIGAALIDRWENLVLGESIIRNIQIGRGAVKRAFGIDSPMVGHPDLPGLNSQTSQIYAQAGIEYYVTSRKIFHEGRVWRHEAPDGTRLLMMTWPVHYVFTPLQGCPIPLGSQSWEWVQDHHVSAENIQSRYPKGTMGVAASSGDLTTAGDFAARYTKDLNAFIDDYRSEFPDAAIAYSTPETVMRPYVHDAEGTEVVTGTLPSVWGVAADEENRFFLRVRAVEHLLLSAESASVFAHLDRRTPLPASASSWSGLYGEQAFFADLDTPPSGREWEWLWRMHVFTQDHNGGGQDGPLSIFEKRVRHDRARGYAWDVIEHALGGDEAPAVLNPRLGDAERLTVLADGVGVEGDGAERAVDVDGDPVTLVNLEPISGVAHRPLVTVAPSSPAPTAVVTDAVIGISTESLRVDIDRVSATVRTHDAASGESWVSELGALVAVRETGNDVTLATDESVRTSAAVTGVELVHAGELAALVRVDLELLGVPWRALVTVWAAQARVDLDVSVDWPGHENWQVRLPVVASTSRDTLSYGTAFHGSRWDDVDSRNVPLMPDEISPADHAAYREIQHWVAAHGATATVHLATAHPAFHEDGALNAVLLRTSPSCGEPRMNWNNAGANRWHLELRVVRDGSIGALVELGDRAWRTPVVVSHGTGASTNLLHNTGDAVILTALLLDGGPVARLLNHSDHPAVVRLEGPLACRGGALVDLAGNASQQVPAVDGAMTFTLAPWRIQTVALNAGTEASR